MRSTQWGRVGGALLLALVSAGACSSTTREDGQTNFFGPCEASGDCARGLSCQCGVCTASCQDGTCPADLDAVCLAPAAPILSALCSGPPDSSLCFPMMQCLEGGDACSALAGCTGCGDAGSQADVDPGVDAATGTLPPFSFCAEAPPPRAFSRPSYFSDLGSYCEGLDAAGVAPCPTDRTAFLAGVVARCGPGGTFPSLDRRCGFDHVSFYVNDTTVRWVFDAATGTLVGGSVVVQEGRLPCGGRSYRGGPVVPQCTTSQGSCSLCVAEPDECPADISALMPITSCSPAAPDVPDCSCEGIDGGIFGLPEQWATCGAEGQCLRCQSGTCWSDCRCLRDGALRYVTQCTE